MKKYLNSRMIVTQYITDLNNVGTNKNDIVSYLFSYPKEDMLFAQILFVVVYIKDFYDNMCQ